jgi:hypothetical protein
MMAITPHFDSSDLNHYTEPGMPYFLDGFDADSDDLGDWWLDLGAVDLSLVPGV